MKKFISSFLVIIIMAISATSTFAQTTSSKVYTIKGVQCAKKTLQDEVSITVDKYNGYKIFTLKNPNRIVIDIPNTNTSINQQKITVNSKRISSVRYAQFDSNTSRVVIDTIGNVSYQVEEKTGKLVFYVIAPVSKNLVYYLDVDRATLVLNGAKLYDSQLGKKLYTEKYESNGLKYYITFPSSIISLISGTIKINDALINSIQVSTNSSTKQTSIIFSTKEKLVSALILKPNVNGSVFRIGTKTIIDKGGDVRPTPNPTPTTPPTTTPSPSSTPSPTPTSSPTPTGLPPECSNVDVSYSAQDSKDIVTINANKYDGYNIQRLTGSDRIVIDIPNGVITDGSKTVNSSLISKIRYAQNDGNVARVVLDTKGQVQYNVDEEIGYLTITVEKPTYKNIVYHNSGDRIYFTLNKAILTSTGNNLTKYYTGSYDPTGNTYTVTFATSKANIGSGIIKINDSLLGTVQITNNTTTKKTSITFNAKYKLVYEVIYRDSTQDTAITLIKPYSKADRVVVIDPGHGGVDPGATSGSIKEKDLNLDISLRLKELLEKKNIKAYITRDDDSYVGLYERAYIANDLNASLFLCVHNNSYDASANGTETLYNTNGSGSFTSKRFAQIVQNSLVNTLKSYSRGIVSRPELVVLKATKMPASLAEVGFITNSKESAKLITASYRQQAAQALCNAVIQSLKEQNN